MLHNFDKLMILAHGHTVYFGKARKAYNYFSEIGYTCPEDENQTDFFIKVIHYKDENGEMAGFGQTEKRAKYLGRTYKKSKYFDAGLRATVPQPLDFNNETKIQYPNFVQQLYHLSLRELQIITRDPSAFIISVVTNLFIGVVIGLIYLQMKDDQAGIQNRGGVLFFILLLSFFGGLLDPFRNVNVESRVFYFQNQEGLISVGPYFLSRIIIKAPFNWLANLAFVTIVYMMVGLQYTAAKFFILYAVVIALAWSSLGLGFFLMFSLDPLVAQTLYPVIFLPMMIFSGFYSNSARVPVWLSWLEVLSFIRYGYRAAARDEFTGLKLYCKPSELVGGICPYTTGEEYLAFRDLDKVPIYYDIITLACIGTGFLILAYMVMSAKIARTKND